MKKSFQKVLKIKPPGDFFTFRRLLYLGGRSHDHGRLQT